MVNRTGRRTNARLRLHIPAQLLLLDGRHNCLLENLSRSGARVRIAGDALMKAGDSAILTWVDVEAFCTIAWVRGAVCGLAFEASLEQQTMLQARWMSENYDKYEREACRVWAKKWVHGKA